MSVRDKISFLNKKLMHHNELYRKDGVSDISDSEYDEMFDELVALETKYPQYKISDSITSKVGHPSYRNKVKHEQRMYSLSKVFDIEELHKYFASKIDHDVQMYADLKNDGVALKLIYANGKLKHALTRGDGKIGRDVTQNIKYTSNHLQIPYTAPLTVVGELTLAKKDLKKVSDLAGTEFKTTRHAVVSFINSKEPNSDIGKYLSFYAYGVYGTTYNFHSEALRFVEKDLNFKRSPWVRFKLKDISVLNTLYKRCLKDQQTFDNPIDGIVVRIDDLRVCEEIGYTERAPRFSLALKFKEDGHLAEISNITFNFGESGVITPIAHLKDHVVIHGVSVKKISLHSVGNLKELGINPGSKVNVILAGKIIPHIQSVISISNPSTFSIPDTCWVCGSKLTFNTKHLKCQNVKCKELRSTMPSSDINM
jgi:DNA ligase (NAD+)